MCAEDARERRRARQTHCTAGAAMTSVLMIMVCLVAQASFVFRDKYDTATSNQGRQFLRLQLIWLRRCGVSSWSRSRTCRAVGTKVWRCWCMRHLYVAMVDASTYSTARGTGDYMCVKVQQHDAWKDSWTCSLLPAGSRTLWRYARRGMVRAEFTGPRGTQDLSTAA